MWPLQAHHSNNNNLALIFQIIQAFNERDECFTKFQIYIFGRNFNFSIIVSFPKTKCSLFVLASYPISRFFLFFFHSWTPYHRPTFDEVTLFFWNKEGIIEVQATLLRLELDTYAYLCPLHMSRLLITVPIKSVSKQLAMI